MKLSPNRLLRLLSSLLIAGQLPTVLMVLYLDLLSVAAVFRRRASPFVPPHSRFAILVPAHDEEVLLPRLLRSLSALDYPSDLFDVHVVADNCSDRTAALACELGAIVHERHNDDHRGKGYALRWLLDRVGNGAKSYDAYVVLDADSVVSPNFLQIMNQRLAAGDQVIQSYYGVQNYGEAWSSAIRYAAMVLFNDLRPRGRDGLGLSAGLRGNGMCFRAGVIERYGWESFTLAEDVEFHLKLVHDGLRVSYAPEAAVLSDMPVSLQQAGSQNVRWERGRLQMLRAYGPTLLRRGIELRNASMLDALAEQLVPPLSVLTAATVAIWGLTVVTRQRTACRLASLVLIGQVAYVAIGLALVHAPRSIYLALLRAPFYIVWKVWIYLKAAAHISDSRWIRTSRRIDSR